MSILIRNLPKTFTETELEALFSPFGEISKCDLVMDKVTGQTKGFGFVEMADADATDKAIKTLNATDIDGQRIRVKWSNQEKKNPVERQDEPAENTIAKDYSGVWESAKSRVKIEDDNEQ
ncbi:RNA recognition motif domain-containing protein [Planctobacterium marinum]|uniref:RRM domain-containing protein n=1 Tax=Planctobacterium marinum TaxID=1631968 RepID=A0AA48HUV2_9ALTE|nr:hypothetical protein MACH26_18190 [Planctobacterium marinum]